MSDSVLYKVPEENPLGMTDMEKGKDGDEKKAII